VENALQLLARAVRQFHTYPATSPLCVEAVAACQDALSTLPHRDRVSARVTPHDLVVGEVHVGSGTVIEQELSRRLFKLRVAGFDIDCGATARDLSRFCIDLVEADEQHTGTSFADRLAEHGVETIVPSMAHTPVVIDVGVTPTHALDLVEQERRRRDTLTPADAPVSHLYPPDKGWVRTDPSEPLSNVSLLDLVILVDSPAEIATMLVRLTDDEGQGCEPQAALERKYSDVARLFSALDPGLAQVMFRKLARAVLDLDTDRRNSLLQRTILPGLLDGDEDGRVLHDFPDMDLAEAVCLLLDLETAAPEVLSAALNRLDVSADRRAALVPLIEARMRARSDGRFVDGHSSGVDRYIQHLVRVDATSEADFSEFSAFDLSMDSDAEVSVTVVRDGIAETDVVVSQLRCLSRLAHLERKPEVAEALLARALELLATLERAGRWAEIIAELELYGRLADELKARRPDVAVAIGRALARFCTPGRLLTLANLRLEGTEGPALAQVLRALGAWAVPGFIDLTNESPYQMEVRSIVPLMCDMAQTVAPALLAELGTCRGPALRAAVKVLGHAGAGYETAVGRFAQHDDPQLAREALRALARMGTRTAAGLVARHMRDDSPDRRASAEEALWHFPPSHVAEQLSELLRSRDFVAAHPQVVGRLLDRAAHARLEGLDQALQVVESFRFRFWKPRLMQAAMKARGLRRR
jgi:hypothetical protein